jgi:U4/U6.U5 tri-snRNP component SNU23
VKIKISTPKMQIEEKKSRPSMSSIDSYESRVAAQIAEQELKKKQRKEEKEKQKAAEQELLKAGEDGDDEDAVDPGIAEMMGFGGFGSSKK